MIIIASHGGSVILTSFKRFARVGRKNKYNTETSKSVLSFADLKSFWNYITPKELGSWNEDTH